MLNATTTKRALKSSAFHLALAAGLCAGAFAVSGGQSASALGECDFSNDGGGYFTNPVGGAGCVSVRILGDGQLQLANVVVTPGWTYEVRNSGQNRVEVRFTNAETGARIDFRTEPGKTIIK